MKLGIITYDTQHLKTEQVALGLHQMGYKDMQFFALPFVPRPPRNIIFAHRPDMSLGAHSRVVARLVGASYAPISTVDEIPPDCCDYFLIAGAGLLPKKFVDATLSRVVNSHPGLIPLVRGLDAFKWAILDQQPIANSLHFIDAEADAGEVFAQSATPLFRTDSLERFALRHYELEIIMMINFRHHLEGHRSGMSDFPEFNARPARMRMKPEQQQLLFDAFEAYREKFALEDN